MRWRDAKGSEANWSEVKWSEGKWSEVTWSEVRQSQSSIPAGTLWRHREEKNIYQHFVRSNAFPSLGWVEPSQVEPACPLAPSACRETTRNIISIAFTSENLLRVSTRVGQCSFFICVPCCCPPFSETCPSAVHLCLRIPWVCWSSNPGPSPSRPRWGTLQASS